jgi:DNA-binding NtrC family response regulator
MSFESLPGMKFAKDNHRVPILRASYLFISLGEYFMRLSPRIKQDFPVIVSRNSNGSSATLSNLSLGGAFLRAHLPAPKIGDSISFKYFLQGCGCLEHQGRITRNAAEGIAVAFYDLDAPTKVKLWGYIAERLKDLGECPYCGNPLGKLSSECSHCGWNLEFHSPVYLEYHQKTCLLRSLQSKAERLSAEQLCRVVDLLDPDVSRQPGTDAFPEFVGTSPAMKKVYVKIRKVAPTDVPVLILGETGTGKELTALAIHQRSTRKEKAFIPINCAAIPENLLEAELFGYEKGSYTGAHARKLGKFEYADGGTLFLDEIAEITPILQVKLLRFLENQVVERIGALAGKRVDVRFISATNCNLQSAVASGRFRPDLFYRLETFAIELPPLRERGEDTLLLGQYFLKQFCRQMGVAREFSPEAFRAMKDYGWPGNVREVANKIRKALVMSSSHFLNPADLDLSDSGVCDQEPWHPENGNGRGMIEKQRVIEALELCRHNISKTAKILGVSRPTVYSLKRKYEI